MCSNNVLTIAGNVLSRVSIDAMKSSAAKASKAVNGDNKSKRGGKAAKKGHNRDDDEEDEDDGDIPDEDDDDDEEDFGGHNNKKSKKNKQQLSQSNEVGPSQSGFGFTQYSQMDNDPFAMSQDVNALDLPGAVNTSGRRVLNTQLECSVLWAFLREIRANLTLFVSRYVRHVEVPFALIFFFMLILVLFLCFAHQQWR
jgi:hypothetical protein